MAASTSRPAGSAVVALSGAVAAWVTSVLASSVLATRMDLVTVRDLVVYAVVSAALSGVVAVTGVGFWAGRRDRDAGTTPVLAAALGASGYLVAGAVLVMLGGQVEVGAANLAGGLGGVGIGAGCALLLLSRGSGQRTTRSW